MAQSGTLTEASTQSNEVRAVTPRSVAVSILVITVSVLWDEWNPYYSAGSNISRSHFPMAFFFPFLATCLTNLLVNNIWPGTGLSRSELLVVLGSGFIGVSVAYDGLTGHFFGVLASPDYFDSVENGWALYLHDHIPSWLAPTNATGEMTRFFEGGSGTPPWRIWVTPIFWWMCFFGALAFAVFCMLVILRKQWVDYERLSYPLVEVAQSLTDTEKGGKLDQMLRSPLFWIAFSLVMGLKLWNIASSFTPAFPFISIEETIWQPFPDFPNMVNRLSFYAIGFGYFASLDVLFSVWFFIILTAFEVYIFNIFGYKTGAATHHWTSDALGWQSNGALVFLSVWGLWMARSHLKSVIQKAFHSDSDVDDSGELLSYRTAVFGLLGSLLFVIGWLYEAGMPLWVIGVFLPLALMLFLGLSRAIAELGLVYIYYRIQPHDTIVQAFGSSIIGFQGITSLAFMHVFNQWPDIGKGFLMPAFTQAVKAVDKVVSPRRITTVLWLGLALGFTISVIDTLYLSYEYGAYNLGNMGMKKTGPVAFGFAVSEIKNPKPPGGEGRVMWAAVGMGIMALLTFVRYWIPRWPLHPIGLAMQGNFGVSKTVFSTFIVWGIKSVLMAFGGIRLYEKGKPFFIGLLAAQAVSTALGFVVDCIWFPQQGHNVHNF